MRGSPGALLGFFAALLLGSCAPAVLLSPEASALRPAIEAALPKGTRVFEEGSSAASKALPRNIVRITSTPGWNLAPGAREPIALPAGWNPSYRPFAPLAALCQRADGSWLAVPLLFDAWGKTAFVKDLSGPPPSGDWTEMCIKGDPASLMVSGSRPSFRQAAFFLESNAGSRTGIDAGSWFSQGAKGWADPASVFSALALLPSWAKDTWHFTQGDTQMNYTPAAKASFLETYRDFERSNTAGVRRFTPLAAKQGKGHVTAGIVLFAEYRGDRGAMEKAITIIKRLSDHAFIKEAGMTEKWLAANGAEQELDSTGAHVRSIVGSSDRFFPLTDRLPDPLIENNLIVSIQLAFDRVARE